MANNYSSASFVIPVKDAELTRKRMQAIVEWIDTYTDDEAPAGALPADLFGDKASEIAAELDERRKEHGDLGFAWSVDNTDLGFYHDESIDMESAVRVAQIMLDLDDNDGVFMATFAWTCSKPRVDEFGGGAVAFSRHADEWKDTYTLATELAAKLTGGA